MGLEKAILKRHIPSDGEMIEVLFNPTEYRLAKTNQFAEAAVPGLEASPIQFTRGAPATLSMQLFLDTYEQGVDVRTYTRKITDLMKIDSELHSPPVCLFTWGDFSFVGVLERADQNFTLFLPNGHPVRATIDVTMKEYFVDEKQIGQTHSANYAKHHTVQRGDTLSSIAAQNYGDPAQWRRIAEANQLDDPLAIQPGQRLVIPPIE